MLNDGVVTKLNEIDERLRSTLNLPRSAKALNLEQAVAKSAATTEEVLFGGQCERVADMPAVAQRLLAASLQAQVEAHLIRVRNPAATVRSVIDSIRRMKAASSVEALERQLCIELCRTAGFGNALLSSVAPDTFIPLAAHRISGITDPLAHSCCFAELDCIRLRRSFHAGSVGLPASAGYCEMLQASAYVVAPIVVGAKVVGLIHVSRADREIGNDDIDTLGLLVSVYSCLHDRLLNLGRVEHLRESITAAAARLVAETDRIADTPISLDTASRPSSRATVDAFATTLSRRERRVFEQMVSGNSNAEIANELVVSIETVKTHVKRILRKIGAANRLEAITLYMEAQNRARTYARPIG